MSAEPPPDLAWTGPKALVQTAEQYVDLEGRPLPFESPTIDTFAFGHPRMATDPGHRWMRGPIIDAASAPDVGAIRPRRPSIAECFRSHRPRCEESYR